MRQTKGQDFELPEFSNEEEEKAFAEKLATQYNFSELETLSKYATSESRWEQMLGIAMCAIEDDTLSADSEDSEGERAQP